MSRASAKLAVIHDLQGYVCDAILTKKDCDLIVKGLGRIAPNSPREKVALLQLGRYFKSIGKNRTKTR